MSPFEIVPQSIFKEIFEEKTKVFKVFIWFSYFLNMGKINNPPSPMKVGVNIIANIRLKHVFRSNYKYKEGFFLYTMKGIFIEFP